jgi:hypothetical protein
VKHEGDATGLLPQGLFMQFLFFSDVVTMVRLTSSAFRLVIESSETMIAAA